MNAASVAKRAGAAAKIFDLVAWAVIVFGALAAVVAFVVSYAGDGSFLAETVQGVFAAIGVAIYTAILWAGVTLSTAIAGYIANRSQEPGA